MNYRASGWTLLAIAVLGVMGWWVHNLIQENRTAVHALFLLDKLKERSDYNPVVKSALDAAEHDYQEWQEEKRIERQAGR